MVGYLPTWCAWGLRFDAQHNRRRKRKKMSWRSKRRGGRRDRRREKLHMGCTGSHSGVELDPAGILGSNLAPIVPSF